MKNVPNYWSWKPNFAGQITDLHGANSTDGAIIINSTEQGPSWTVWKSDVWIASFMTKQMRDSGYASLRIKGDPPFGLTPFIAYPGSDWGEELMTQYRGQSFRPLASSLWKVRLKIGNNDTSPQNVTVRLHQDSWTGPELGRSVESISYTGPYPKAVFVDFVMMVSGLDTEKTYYLTIDRVGKEVWLMSRQDSYNYGSCASSVNGDTYDVYSRDLDFKIWFYQGKTPPEASRVQILLNNHTIFNEFTLNSSKFDSMSIEKYLSIPIDIRLVKTLNLINVTVNGAVWRIESIAIEEDYLFIDTPSPFWHSFAPYIFPLFVLEVIVALVAIKEFRKWIKK